MQKRRKVLSLLLALGLVLTSFSVAAAVEGESVEVGGATKRIGEDTAAGAPGNIISYEMVVEGFDWGPGVTRLILALDNPVTSVEVEDFAVSFYREPGFRFNLAAPFEPFVQPANVTNAFVSDANGMETAEAGAFITLELMVHPDGGIGINPFTFVLSPMGNNWADPFETSIVWNAEEFTPTRTTKTIPIADDFSRDNLFTYEGVTLQYGYFTPPEAQASPRPLIIWLHGAGEGSRNLTAGTDAALLGNRVIQLAAPKIQEIMGGAYVLVPQAPTVWMMGTGAWGGTGYVSNYEDALMALIEDFIANTPGIDERRVFVGGCSNGGYMTIRALMRAPELFAASFPVCLLYNPDWITDEKIESIAHIPMWLIHDIADPTTPHAHSLYIYQRLKDLGGEVYLTTTNGLFSDEFFDAAGNPWEFNRHWSWIPVLNNTVFEEIDGEQMSLFAWMAAQRRGPFTLTFHLYTENQMILDRFAAYITDVVDGRAVIVVPVVPGTDRTTWAGLEDVFRLGHVYGTTDRHGYAFWGWFDNESLDDSGRMRGELRRPALTRSTGEGTCLLADILEQVEKGTAIFIDGNLDLYGVWVRFGDVDDNGIVNMADISLLQRYINFGHVMEIAICVAAGDVVVDSAVNMLDLFLLQRYVNLRHIMPIVPGAEPQS